jgi:carbon monoxide dehydrogenase subunit G
VQLENSFTVPLPIDEAWRVLLDVERIAPCMPGAALDSVTGDDFTGRVKVKLGPINLTYQGKGSFVEKDEAAHRAVIDAKGKDQRGNGTAAATITAKLAEEGTVTRVDVLTDLNITGRPAQFGRGVMTDVGNKLLGQFADKLAAQLSEGDRQDVHVDTVAAAQQQEPTPIADAAATAAGIVGEVAASAGQVPGDGAAASTVRETASTVETRAASASDRLASASAPSSGPSGTTAPPSRPASSGPARVTPAPAAPRAASAEPEPIDLLEVAGGAAFSRFAAPAAAGGVLLLLVTLLLRRRSRRRR